MKLRTWSLAFASTALLVTAAACGGQVSTPTPTATPRQDAGTTTTTNPTNPVDPAPTNLPSNPSTPAADPGPCTVTSTSTLPGVRIVIPTPSTCTFTLAQAAAKVRIPYQIVIDSDVAGVTPRSREACAEPGPSGLMTLARLQGDSQSYCICDQGLCAPNADVVATLKKGTYDDVFEWDGRNFNGPSDTGNQPGAAFPPGDYTLTVEAGGLHAADADAGAATTTFTMAATLIVHLLP